MKSKCSFILKASTALLLALLMLFGTVATSMAAVVENADTGAVVDITDSGLQGVWIQSSQNGYGSTSWQVDNATGMGTNAHFRYVYFPQNAYFRFYTNNKYGPSTNNASFKTTADGDNGKQGGYNGDNTWQYKSASQLVKLCIDQNDGKEWYPWIWLEAAQVYVVGDSGLCGANWTHGTAADKMTLSSGKYTLTKTVATAGTYEFKISDATSWNSYNPCSSNQSVTTTHANDQVTITFDPSNNSVTTSVTHPSYTITLNKNGGTINAGNVTSYNCGTGATLPTNVTKTGYTFGGWFDNSSCTGTAVTSISTSATGNKEFWAKWTPKSYNITYKDQGNVAFSGTHASGYPTTHTYGTATTLKSASKTGYTFGGWYTNSNCTGTAVTSLGATAYTSDITLYAKWTQNTYAITLSETGASGGTMQVDSAAFTSGSTVTHGNHTFRVDAPSGYVIDTISGIGSWTKSDDNSYATLGSTSITSAQTITVTYAAAGRPSLAAIADVTKDANTTTFNVTATINDEDKKSGTLTATASSSDTTVATVGTPSVSGSTVTIPVTIKGKVDSSTITVNLLDAGSTVSTQTFSVEMEEPTFTINSGAVKWIYCSTSAASLSPSFDPTPSEGVTYSSNNSEYITVNSSAQVGAAKVPTSQQTATITAVATYSSGYTKTVTATVKMNPPTLSASASPSSGNIGTTSTGSITGTNPAINSTYVSSYSWTSSNSNIVSVSSGSTTATPTFTLKKSGSATITAKVTYKNGLTNSTTTTITVNDPTVAFGDTSAASINVGGTVTRTATGSTVGTVTSDTITYSSDATAVATVNSSGVITGKTSGTANISATRTIVCGGQTTTVSTTSNVAVTVKTPVVSLTDATVAVDDTVTLAAPSVTNVTGTPTYTYTSSDSTKATVTNEGVVTGVAAGTATITVTATLGTWSGTGTATVTVEAPKVEAEDVDDEDVKYLTVGTDFVTDLSNNFSGAYTVSSSNTSVATVSESSGTLTVVPVAKGTATITVTASKGGNGSNTPGYLKSLFEVAATGADVTGKLIGTGIQAEMTFTVNVAEASTDKYIYLVDFVYNNNPGWNSAYIHAWHNDGDAAILNMQQMTLIGKYTNGGQNKNVYAVKVTEEQFNNINNIVFFKTSSTGWDSNNNDGWDRTIKVSHSTNNRYFLWESKSGSYRGVGADGSFDIDIPQVTIDDASTPLGTNYTLNATKVNEATVGKYKWESATTSVATVTADTGTTANTTVVPVDAGTSVITVRAYTAKPTGWNTWAFADLFSSTDTATITVTADDRTVTYSAKASYDHADYDSHDGEGGTITTSPVVTSGGSVAHGTTVTFTATPSSGYKHVGWRVGTGANEFTTSAKEITVRADTTVYALFDKYYTTSITPSAGGTVKVNNANFTGEDVVWNNAPTSITVTPDTGYMIDYENSTNLNKYYTVDTSATSGAVTITGKSDVAEADKSSVKPITVAFKKLSYTVNVSTQYKDDDGDYKAGANTNATGGTITVTNNNGTNTYEYGDIITVTATPNALPAAASFDPAQKYYMVEEIQFSTDGGTTWTHVTCNNESPTYTTAEIYNNTFVINNTGASEYLFRAKFRGVYFLSIYDSWMQDTNNDWQFVAAPPRKVEVGTGASKRTYTYAKGIASTIGEDNAVSLGAAPTEHHIVDATGNYHEGNKLLVYAGEEIKLTYSGLASSDAIRGAYFNNALRYTCEEEDDNLFYHRTYRSGGYGKGTEASPYIYSPTSVMPSGEVPDDDWDYDYAVNTTLYAFEYYYPEPAATTIRTNDENYIAEIDQTAHTITWTATQNYMNIDLELDYKYKVNINKFTGYKSVLNIENMNDEGFYYNGENFDKSSGDTDRRFKISIDSSSDTTGTYSFTDYNGSFVDASGNPAVVTGVAVVGKKSDGTNAASASEVSYFVVEGKMPNSDLYIELPIQKTFKIQMSNIIVTDTAIHRTMLTETGSNSTSNTDSPGTITATVKNAAGEKIDATGAVIAESDTTTAQMDISTDGTTYYTYNTGSSSGPGSTNNTDSSVAAYTDASNNRYLNGGVNVTGSTIPDGYSVTLSYHESNNELGSCYSFIGWYEGSYDSTSHMFTVDYSKKLSGKSTYTYTPKKNTVVIGVGTRDMYLGGTFKNNGDYTDTAADQTWEGSRILMDYDPVTKFYYHTFDEVDGSKVYHLRCYDTASGTKSTNLIAWENWNKSAYNREYGGTGENAPLATDSINLGRWWESDGHGSNDGKSTAYFCMASGWKAEGYDAPVTVKFKASSGGFDAESTYQWAQAYVSAGRGIDVLGTPTKIDEGTDKERWSTTYNVPSVAVKNKTVNNKDVTVTHQPEKYGATTTDYDVSTKHYEYIDECLVKEDNGEIIVAAYPNDANIDLQAVLVYDIDTKKATAEKTIAYSGADTDDYDNDGNTSEEVYVVNVMIPRATKVYVVPIYKFKDSYIANPSNNMESHTVYVNTEDLNKNDWGGLVAMYSWGTSGGYDSGGWPGQLMIPSDDGKSFYAPLSFFKNGLAGVTFDNYNVIWGGQNINFIGTYKDHSVSDTVYCNNLDTHIHQNYDYREPISIINNINVDTNSDGISDVYLSEDMDLTFALKDGDLTDIPTINTAGSDASNRVSDWKKVGYLTDRSGKNRVDLNGNTVDNATETYRIIAYYTNKYSSSGTGYSYNSTSGNGTSYSGSYSINWTVYDTTGTKIIDGTTNDTLSASFTDVVADPDHENGFISYIASKLLAAGQPVIGKAVKIAYENPGTWSEAIRYSGQWYADGVNTLIEGKTRVGTISDGVYSPMNNNKLGNDTATVAIDDMNAKIGEDVVGEFEVANKSKAIVAKAKATNGKVSFTATNTSGNFVGWYYAVTDDDGNITGYEPAGANYKDTTITPSFNDDITYYAFYKASAIYNFNYSGRFGSKTFTMQGKDLSEKELADGGTLDKSDPDRIADVVSKLSKITDITVFNKTTGFTISASDAASFNNDTPYQFNINATSTDTTYTTTVYAYNESGVLGSPVKTVTGTWARKVDLGVSYIANKPSGKDNYKFAGWIKYGTGSSYVAGDSSTYPAILSTQANFGYSVSDNISIEPFFVATDAEVTALRGTGWQAGIDKVGVTQELTSSTTGRIYTDTLINIRNNEATGEKYTGDSGLLVIFQTGESTNDATYSTAFDSLAANTSQIQSFVRSMASGADNAGENFRSAKLGASRGVGDAYAYRIKTTSLSDLNRADLYMGCDYSQFTGGKFLVVSYTKDGDSYTYSPIKTGTFTPGQKFPAV